MTQDPTPAVTTAIDVEVVMAMVIAYGAECGRGDGLADRAQDLLAGIRELVRAYPEREAGADR